MGEKFIKVAEFSDYIQANLVKGRLSENGIKAVLTGENTSSVYSGLGQVAHVELLVPENQVSEARDVLVLKED